MSTDGKSKGKDSVFSDYKFIQHKLTTRDVEELEALNGNTEWPLARILDLVEEGYKVSFSPDFNHMSIVVTATDKQEHSPFFKHTLSGRGATPIDAWHSLAYRHYVLAAGDWSYFGLQSDSKPSKYG